MVRASRGLIPGVEPPVDDRGGRVALRDQGLDLSPECLLIGEPQLGALARWRAKLNLRHGQLTPVLGCVSKLKLSDDPPGFCGLKALVRGCRAMGVLIVQDDSHHFGPGIGFVHQLSHLPGEILPGAPFSDCHMPPARLRLTGQEQIAGTTPTLFVLLPHWPRRT